MFFLATSSRMLHTVAKYLVSGWLGGSTWINPLAFGPFPWLKIQRGASKDQVALILQLQLARTPNTSIFSRPMQHFAQGNEVNLCTQFAPGTATAVC